MRRLSESSAPASSIREGGRRDEISVTAASAVLGIALFKINCDYLI